MQAARHISAFYISSFGSIMVIKMYGDTVKRHLSKFFCENTRNFNMRNWATLGDMRTLSTKNKTIMYFGRTKRKNIFILSKNIER